MVGVGGGPVLPGVTVNVPVAVAVPDGGVPVAVGPRLVAVAVVVPLTVAARVGVLATAVPPGVAVGPKAGVSVGATVTFVTWRAVPVGPAVGNTGVLIPLSRKARGSAVPATNGFGWMMRSTCKYQTLLVSGCLPQPTGPLCSRQIPSRVIAVPALTRPSVRSKPCVFNCNPSETSDQ